MKDPIIAYEEFKDGIKRYVTSAFSSNSETFERDRKKLLDQSGIFFQEPYVEPIPSYKSGKFLSDLDNEDTPTLSKDGLSAFKKIVGNGLFDGRYPLYLHQQRMLSHAMQGQHCVIVTGTGSGKTESFLLPALANILREATNNDKKWQSPTKNPSSWTLDSPPRWDQTRTNLRGETRPAAVRTLILYPMNALVEDQISRLRKALDSDEVLKALDESLNGNRIRFGRYNGSTPVSGHPFKSDGKSNEHKRTALKNQIISAIKDYLALKAKISTLTDKLTEAEKSSDELKVQQANNELQRAKNELDFVTRMTPDAAEMFHRWEMQAAPPDILVTNVSMLSIMMMRHTANNIEDDRADSDIFKKTREWLEEDKENHVFQLVIDELHLHRNSAGTEVAYLLRLLLERLGLAPESRQLQILASSASLDDKSDETYEYLGSFFGYTPEEAKKRFYIESGELQYSLNAQQTQLSERVQRACLEANKDGNQPHSLRAVIDAISNDHEDTAKTMLSVFTEPNIKRITPKPQSAVAARLFSSLDNGEQLPALSSLFQSISYARENSLSLNLPRFRFHWMAKNIDGIWATIKPKGDDNRRRVGTLLPECKLTWENNRVLEILYCECCGTQLLCGSKIALPSQNPLGINEEKTFELTSLEAQLEGLPESSIETRTDAQTYRDIGVVWMCPPETYQKLESSKLEWRHGSIDINMHNDRPGRPKSRVSASWSRARINPKTGVVNLGVDENDDNSIPCLWFEVDSQEWNQNNQPDQYSGMPQVCPSCQINYSERFGRRTPIRSFVTGLARLSHLFSKHLMSALEEGDSRKLVAFSDSREAAANLSLGVEVEQWALLLRTLVNSELRKRAVSGMASSKAKVLSLIENKKSDEIAKLRNDLKELFDVSAPEISEFNLFIQAARAVIEDQESALEDQIKQVNEIRSYISGYVSIDEMVKDPISQVGFISPLWRALIEKGVNPGGASVEDRKITNGTDWTCLFEKVNGELQPKLAPNKSPEHISKVGRTLKKSIWRTLTGRLLYDLESQGVGHLALPPRLPIPEGLTIKETKYRQICDSVLRILSEESRLDPHPWNGETNPWSYNQPSGDGREGTAKKRVFEFLSQVADKLNISYESLRSNIAKTFNKAGHSTEDEHWGTITIRNLWVRIVEGIENPWICDNCGRIHWHPSAGVCSRCFGTLNDEPNKNLTAHDLTEKNYYAFESKDEKSIFRIHSEELTGQTQNQAQRQRHFRDIFFDHDVIRDIGERPAIRNVDSIDFLSVTTTMEVGVDIGSLQAVLQANMPPERFNYQQRVGRAGRKGQSFAIAFTFCKGQTHDRIHFEHPDEMTGSVPPQPKLAMGKDQQILIERLFAKEILRQAFLSFNVSWADTNSAPDTHGEMGMVTEAGTRIADIKNWLSENHPIISSLAIKLCNGTSIEANDLIVFASKLPEKIENAMSNRNYSTNSFAHRLAEAGILPMFGMPTTVRQLYFEAPKDKKRDPRTLDRPADQAVADFAPGSERTWDKRTLLPKYISAPLLRDPMNHGHLKTNGEPIGAAFIQIRCNACRHLESISVDIDKISTYQDPKGRWNASYLKCPQHNIECQNCNLPEAKIFVAVEPRAFITDLAQDNSARGAGEGKGRSGVTEISSPMLSDKNYSHICNSEVKLAKHASVFRTNTNRGNYFGFVKKSFISQPQQYIFGGGIWFEQDESPEFKVALTSSKTTDILAIRMLNNNGLNYFEELGQTELTRRRAAWYSAATILQRAIALKLDIDSLDIEIASVHSVNSDGGAELYLADAHPNGAGIVESGKNNWSLLLEGCLFGEGPWGQMGRIIKKELSLASEPDNEWRSPDLLLKGFRNRQLHGLLDWELGLDIISCMYSSEFKPGIDSKINGKLLPQNKDRSWACKAKLLVENWASNSFPYDAVVDAGSIQGWVNDNVFHVVVHPLWDGAPGSGNAILEARQVAKDNGCHSIRRIDSFNLSRRMVWVKAKLETVKYDDERLFPIEPIEPDAYKAQRATLEAAKLKGKTIAILPTDAPKIGVYDWEDVENATIENMRHSEKWLVSLGDGERLPVQVTRRIGMSQPTLKKLHQEGFISSNELSNLTLIAKAKN